MVFVEIRCLKGTINQWPGQQAETSNGAAEQAGQQQQHIFEKLKQQLTRVMAKQRQQFKYSNRGDKNSIVGTMALATAVAA